MNRTVRKALCLGMACAFGVSALTACGASKENDTASSAAPAATAAPEKPTPIRIFNRVNAQVVIDNNPVLAEVEKRANVKLTYEAPPINNYLDKLQIVMASGDLPDLIYNWGGADNNMETWAKNGLLAPLDDKITKYPNLMKNISKEMWDAFKSIADGKTYIIPRTNIENHWGYIVNQQWLDKLGMKAPETLEEFTAMCRAFTQKDPDGNGKNDTFGLSMTNPALGSNTFWNTTNYLQTAFDIAPGGAKDTDGKYKIREKMSGYIPYLTYLKQLNDEKIIDPEFLINKIYVDQDKLVQKRIGAVYAHQGSMLGLIAKDKEADKTYTYHAPLKDSKGVANDYVTLATWGGWMISKNSKVIDGVLKFLDWGNTAEATALFQLGLQGQHYDNYDAAKHMVTRTPEQATKLASISSTYMTVANAIGGVASMVEGADTQARLDAYTTQLDAAKKLMTSQVVPAVRSPLILNLNTARPDVVKKKDDMEMKFVLGNITLQQFKDFLEKEWYPATADAENEYVAFMEKKGK